MPTVGISFFTGAHASSAVPYPARMPLSLAERAIIAVLRELPLHALTRAAGRLATLRLPPALQRLEIPGAEPAASPDVSSAADPQVLLDRIKVLEQRISELESGTVLSEPETLVKRIEAYTGGIGTYMDRQLNANRVPELYAAIVLVAFIGYLVNIGLRVVQRRTLFWSGEERSAR